MREKKVFIGLNNIASMFKDLTSGFNKLGLSTLTMSKYPNSSAIINNTEDFNIYKWKKFGYSGIVHRLYSFAFPFKQWWEKKVTNYFLNLAMRECDIFIFISESFRDDLSDLSLLKKHGKTIIFVFVGDDVRWYSAMKQEFEMYGIKPIEYDIPEIFTELTLKKRINKVRIVEKNADFIFSRVDQAQLQLKPYFKWEMMVDSSVIEHNPHQRELCPIIVHAPSSRTVKGTKYVLDACDRLKSEGIIFEVRLIENMANAEAIALYSQADILIDQLLCPGTGKLSTEALASGTIVLSNMSYNSYPLHNPVECPIIDVDVNTLYDTLKSLILNFDFRKKHAKLGRPYVEKYLDVEYFCKKVVALANNEKIQFDYMPTFFRDHYLADNKAEADFLNHWTKEVKNETWYQEFVASGENNRLVF